MSTRGLVHAWTVSPPHFLFHRRHVNGVRGQPSSPYSYCKLGITQCHTQERVAHAWRMLIPVKRLLHIVMFWFAFIVLCLAHREDTRVHMRNVTCPPPISQRVVPSWFDNLLIPRNVSAKPTPLSQPSYWLHKFGGVEKDSCLERGITLIYNLDIALLNSNHYSLIMRSVYWYRYQSSTGIPVINQLARWHLTPICCHAPSRSFPEFVITVTIKNTIPFDTSEERFVPHLCHRMTISTLPSITVSLWTSSTCSPNTQWIQYPGILKNMPVRHSFECNRHTPALLVSRTCCVVISFTAFHPVRPSLREYARFSPRICLANVIEKRGSPRLPQTVIISETFLAFGQVLAYGIH